MSSSKHLFPLLLLLFFLFLFPCGHASNLKKCSSSFEKPLRCGPLEVPIRFPFCDHPGFNLNCNNLNKTVLELPMSRTFEVLYIDYKKQQIHLNDPKICLAKRLLNFNISGSPFFPPFNIYYTVLACPNEVARHLSPSIPCLNNSTSSFFATSIFDLVHSSRKTYNCEVAERLFVPATMPITETGFSSYINNNQSILLQWESPDCRSCELDNLTCGFKNKTSLEVKCFGAKPGYLSNKAIILIISFSIAGGVIFFNVMLAWIGCCIYNTRISDPSGQWNADTISATSTLQPRRTMATRGLDQSTIESYKKVELGESRRLPGINGIVCPICLSEYESKETVRFIPECNHCFHVECIDPWLKIHGSCPLCRTHTAKGGC